MPSAFSRRTSAASRSGMGDETTSANVDRKPPANVSGSCIVRSSGTKVRIVTGSPQLRPRSLMLRMRLRGFLFPLPRGFFLAHQFFLTTRAPWRGVIWHAAGLDMPRA